MNPELRVAAYDAAFKRWHHFSPTLLQAFFDCERVPAYAKILKLPQPPFKAQTLGTAMHAQLEHLARTGQDVLGPRLRELRSFLPAKLPDPEVKAELGLDGRLKGERAYDYAGTMQIEGVPLEGCMDLLECSGVPRVTDYKTTKDVGRWAKTEVQLRSDLQLGIYAKATHAWGLGSGDVRVRHLYAQTEGPASCREVAVTLSLDEINETWTNAEHLARGLKRLEGIEIAEDVERVPRSGVAKGHCQKYAGCPFAKVCLKSPDAMLRLTVSRRNEKTSSESKQTTQHGGDQMSLFAKIKAKQETQAPQGPAPGTPAEVPPSPSAGASVSPPAPSGLALDVTAMLGGKSGSVETLPSGQRLVFDQAGKVVGALPPVVQEAARLIVPTEVLPARPEDVETARRKGILPPDAPPNDANYKPEEKKRGRPKKAEDQKPTTASAPTDGKAAVGPGAAPVPEQSKPLAGQAERGAGAQPGKLPIRLFVNCIPVGEEYQTLDCYAAECAAKIAEALQVEDYRLTDMGAVKGRGGLAAYVRENPPAPGSYVAIAGAFDGPMAVAIEALIPLAGYVVRGVR